MVWDLISHIKQRMQQNTLCLIELFLLSNLLKELE